MVGLGRVGSDCQSTVSILEMGDGGKTQFDWIRFTGALLICYVAHKPLIYYGIYEL